MNLKETSINELSVLMEGGDLCAVDLVATYQEAMRAEDL